MMRRQQAARLRLAWLLWLMALPALVLASASCTRSSQAAAGGHEPTAVVIFVDFSDSVGGMDRTGFKREIDKLILPWLEPGDSFLIAPINDKTLTGFRPLVEAELPARPQFNGFMNNVMKFNREAKATEAKLVQVKETIRTQAGEALSKTSQARYTDIFSSLLLAEKLFSAAICLRSHGVGTPDHGQDSPGSGGAEGDRGPARCLRLRVGRQRPHGGDGHQHRALLGGVLLEGRRRPAPEPLRARPAALAAAEHLPGVGRRRIRHARPHLARPGPRAPSS